MKMKKKKNKNKNLFEKKSEKKQKAKRLTKAKRITKKPKSPFRIIVKDVSVEPFDSDFRKELELNEDSKLEIHIGSDIYKVSINKANRCLEFGTHETHLYLQPISVHQFLVKANSKTKGNESN